MLILNKDDLEFVTQFQCFAQEIKRKLGKPIDNKQLC